MKKFTAAETRDLFGQVLMGEISLSRMVEILNEMVSEEEKKCVEDIPKRKFQKGDKVRIKGGVSSKTHEPVSLLFNKFMDKLIGTTMTVSEYIHEHGYVMCNEHDWWFHEDWLEPYTDELKKGDLVIFWDYDKGSAMIGQYDYLIKGLTFPHRDQIGYYWANAIKFESIEQYERLLKGEI